MKNIIALTASIMMLVGYAYAQNSISGSVFDKDTKEALVGVNIFIPGTQIGTISSFNGSFTLTSTEKIEYITVSYIGYQTTTIPATDSYIEIALKPAFSMLNEIIVSANREQQQRTEAPIAIHSISRLTMNETKAHRLDLLLNKTPGIFMVDLGNEQHSMSIRQPLGYRSLYLYLEDGVPIRATGDFNHNALIEINYSALNRIEVIKGPASSFYGSEAVGGAINFITQPPSLFPTAKLQVEAGNFGYRRSDFFASNTFKKLGLYIGGYYANRNLPDSLHQDFHKLALNLRGDYNFNKRTKLITTAAFIDYKTDQKGGLDSLNFYQKNYVSFQRFTFREINTFRAKTTLNQQWNENANSNFTLFYRNSTITQNPFYRIRSVSGSPNKARGEINEDAFQSFGSIAQHTQKIRFFDAKLTTGLSLDYSPATYYSKFISIDKDDAGIYKRYSATDSLLTKYNVGLLNTAGYFQLEYNPLKQLKITTALRYDRLSYAFDNHLAPSAFTGAPDETNKFDHLTPKIGLTYDFKNDRGIYLNYSTGFSPPNIIELFSGVNVPSLKPAKYLNLEIGGWFAINEKGYIDWSIYQMNGSNEIVSVRLNDGSFQNENAGKTQHKGIETSIKYFFMEGLNIRLGGTYAGHRFIEYIEKGIDYSGNKMGQAPNYIANAEITWKPIFLNGFRMALEWQSVGKYFIDPKNTEEYNGFNVFNIRAGYGWKKCETWINVINLTNATYATTVEKSTFGKNYIPGQLRTFNFGIGYNFSKNK